MGLFEKSLQLTCVNCKSCSAVEDLKETCRCSASGFGSFVFLEPFETHQQKHKRTVYQKGRGSVDESGGIQPRSYYIYKHSWKHLCLTRLLCHWRTSHTSGKNKAVILIHLCLLFRLTVLFRGIRTGKCCFYFAGALSGYDEAGSIPLHHD